MNRAIIHVVSVKQLMTIIKRIIPAQPVTKSVSSRSMGQSLRVQPSLVVLAMNVRLKASGCGRVYSVFIIYALGGSMPTEQRLQAP